MRIVNEKKHLYVDTLQENLVNIGNYNGIECFDSFHAMSQFESRFPNLTKNNFDKVLNDGIKKIFRVFHGELQNYSIESSSTNIKIPLDLKRNRYNHSEIIGLIATTLNRLDHPYNTHEDQSVFVEKTKEEAKEILIEKSKKDNSFLHFQYEDPFYVDYFECGEYYTSYETILVN